MYYTDVTVIAKMIDPMLASICARQKSYIA